MEELTKVGMDGFCPTSKAVIFKYRICQSRRALRNMAGTFTECAELPPEPHWLYLFPSDQESKPCLL